MKKSIFVFLIAIFGFSPLAFAKSKTTVENLNNKIKANLKHHHCHHRHRKCPPGPTGPAGESGAPGSQGPRGPIGPTGPAGESSMDPSFTVTQIVQVNKGGNDTTGNGSDEAPFLTIGRAMSAITDASSSKRYAILVGPGMYDEDVVLKANVFIKGSAPVLTILNSIGINDPSWTNDDDNRSGLENVQVFDCIDVDFVSVQSSQGKFFIFQSRLSCMVDYMACNSSNQLLLYNCELQSDLSHQGGDLLWFSSTTFGNISIFDQISDVNPIIGQPVDTRFFGSGGGAVLPLDGSPFLPAFNVSNNVTSVLSPTNTVLVDLAGFAVKGTLTIIGNGVLGDTLVFATANGVPSVANTSVTANATLTLSTFANGIGYVPSSLTNWSGIAPVSVQNALDRIAATVGPIP